MKKPILLFLALFATLLSPASPRLLTPVSAPSAPTLLSMKHATPIDRVHFDGGYIDDDGKVYYHIGDYQGNVVAVMRGNGIVVQTAHYYPYGEPWLEPDGTNRRLYGGKERIAALGGAYDFGARLLNFRIGTWHQQDPCAEDYRWLSPYSVCAADPVNHIDPDGENPLAIIGAFSGALIGSGIEIAMQLYRDGEVSDWRSVVGAGVQGGIVGLAAGLTGGASLLASSGGCSLANTLGGIANRAIQGEKWWAPEDILTDAVIGGAGAIGGTALGEFTEKGLNRLSPAAKGKLGEMITKIKYNLRGYESTREFKVKTGYLTPKLGKDAVAKYDFLFENKLTGKRIIRESKFNNAQLTINQKLARANVIYEFDIDRTTSTGVAGWVKSSFSNLMINLYNTY